MGLDGVRPSVGCSPSCARRSRRCRDGRRSCREPHGEPSGTHRGRHESEGHDLNEGDDQNEGELEMSDAKGKPPADIHAGTDGDVEVSKTEVRFADQDLDSPMQEESEPRTFRRWLYCEIADWLSCENGCPEDSSGTFTWEGRLLAACPYLWTGASRPHTRIRSHSARTPSPSTLLLRGHMVNRRSSHGTWLFSIAPLRQWPASSLSC